MFTIIQTDTTQTQPRMLMSTWMTNKHMLPVGLCPSIVSLK